MFTKVLLQSQACRARRDLSIGIRKTKPEID